MKTEQTNFLIDIIKTTLGDSKQDQFIKALESLEEKFKTVKEEQYISPDDFVVECVESFYEGNIEFSDEVYRGLNMEDIMSSINDLARDFKIALCDILKKNPDTDLVNSAGDIWKDYVKLIIAKLIEMRSGIPDEMTAIMFSAMVVYCISYSITNICA